MRGRRGWVARSPVASTQADLEESEHYHLPPLHYPAPSPPDVYVIDYESSFNQTTRLAEKPVIVVGTYHAPSNVLKVENITPYSQLDLPQTTVAQRSPRSVWDNIWQFITQFR